MSHMNLDTTGSTSTCQRVTIVRIPIFHLPIQIPAEDKFRPTGARRAEVLTGSGNYQQCLNMDVIVRSAIKIYTYHKKWYDFTANPSIVNLSDYRTRVIADVIEDKTGSAHVSRGERRKVLSECQF